MAKQEQSVTFTLRAKDHASREINGVMGQLQRLGNVSKAAIGALATTTIAATAALARMTQQGMRTADETAKMARRLQMTNAEMRTLQLQAELTGTPIERLTRGIAQMSAQMQNFTLTTQGRTAIAQLGLDITQLQGMRPVEQFRAIATALGNVESAGVQSSLAAVLFKDRAGEMLEIIRQGASGLDRTAEMVEKYGLALDAMDSAAIERANDAMTVLRFQFQAFREGLAAGLAPILEHIVTKTNDMVWAWGGATRAGVQFVDLMVTGLPIVERLWAGLLSVVLAGSTGMLSITWGILKGMQGLLMLEDAVAGIFNIETDGLSEQIGLLAGDVEKAMLSMSEQTNGALARVFSTDMDKWKNWALGVAQSLGTITEGAAAAAKTITVSTTNNFTELNRVVSNAANTIERSLTEAFMTGKLNAREMIRSIISDIIALTIRVAIIRPLFGAIGTAFGGTALGAAFTSAAAPPGRRIGGMVGAGEVKRVGEDGPEDVFFGSSAYIRPTQKESQTVQIFADMRGASIEAVSRLERFVAEINGSLEQRAVAAVANNYRRQPNYLMR